MKKVGVGRLKASLSEYLRAVKQGETVTVLDRDHPVAQIVPIRRAEQLPSRKPTRRLRDVVLPASPAGRVDSLAVLLQERQVER